MRYTVDMDSDGIIYVPSFMKIGSGSHVIQYYTAEGKELGSAPLRLTRVA
jgi:hypothetical protein